MAQLNAAKNLGDENADLKTGQGLWQYVETQLAAEVRARDIVLRPHWKGAMSSDEIRDVIRLASAAPALYEALRNIAERGGRRECERYSTGIGSCFEQHRRADALFAAEKCCAPCIANAAVALVNKPDTNSANSIHPAYEQASKTEVQK